MQERLLPIVTWLLEIIIRNLLLLSCKNKIKSPLFLL